MGFFKKIFRPIRKVLDKVVPNEIKPFLPYAAAAVPFLAPTSGIFGTMAGRGFLSGGANILSQLAQEDADDDINWLSALMAGGTGALSAPGAGKTLRGMQGTYNVHQDPTFFQTLGDKGLGYLAKGADFLGGAGDILRPGGTELTMKNALNALSVPAIQGTGDAMAFEAESAMREYEKALAEYNAEQGAMGTDEGRREAILAAMRAYNHPEDLIETTLEELGLRDGGRVAYNMGGRIGYRRGNVIQTAASEDAPFHQQRVLLEDLDTSGGVNSIFGGPSELEEAEHKSMWIDKRSNIVDFEMDLTKRLIEEYDLDWSTADKYASIINFYANYNPLGLSNKEEILEKGYTGNNEIILKELDNTSNIQLFAQGGVPYNMGGRVGLTFGGIPAAVQAVKDETYKEDMALLEMDIDWVSLAQEFEETFNRPHQNDKELFDFYRDKYGADGIAQRTEIEEKFTETAANGGIMAGRKPFVSGGIGKGLLKLLGKSDDTVDIAKQTETFREGPITAKFMETVDKSVIAPAIRTRDMHGPGGYGLYKNFEEMPAGLQAAELISRIKKADGTIDYKAAEIFIGRKLKGNETIDELIAMVVRPQNIADQMTKIKKTSDELGKAMTEYENIYKPKRADGGIMNYNMGGSVLPNGIEVDYRGGGFIPMGSKERADDVPARVSKNEFVMTADAVRAAGGGSVQQGAKKMYELMNNLEARA